MDQVPAKMHAPGCKYVFLHKKQVSIDETGDADIQKGDEAKSRTIFMYKSEHQGNYISIKCVGKNYITRETMKEMEGRLPGDQFVRINKSYIVSIQKLIRVYGNTVVLADEEIPIGKVFKMKFMEKLQQS